MDDNSRQVYERLAERYASGDVPWDDPLPPPEVIETVSDLLPGRALDLGCGYGRASIYLAQHGWDVDGIDFIPEAIHMAATRSRAAHVEARFHITPVTDLAFLAGPYDYALDVGCCHNMDQENLTRYRDHLCRLIRPTGVFMVFARLRAEDSDDEDGFGIPRAMLERTLAGCMDLERVVVGRTDTPEQASWPSAWFWFRRR
jgi:SAM-dependent methyltransferase